jgi:hypothetical protein
VDSSDAVVSGASVVAVNTATTISRTEVTNQDGIFVFPDLPIGAYQLQNRPQRNWAGTSPVFSPNTSLSSTLRQALHTLAT